MNPATTSDLYIGKRLLCHWRQGPYAFPATVTGFDDDQITVRYDDGDEEQTTLKQLQVPGTADRATHTWESGNQVLVRRSSSPYWYPGTIQKVETGRYLVRLDCGITLKVHDDQLAPLDIQENSRVFARYDGGILYYPGKVVRLDGDQLTIRYDDGDEETTTLASIRVAREEPVDQPILPQAPATPKAIELPLIPLMPMETEAVERPRPAPTREEPEAVERPRVAPVTMVPARRGKPNPTPGSSRLGWIVPLFVLMVTAGATILWMNPKIGQDAGFGLGGSGGKGSSEGEGGPGAHPPPPPLWLDGPGSPKRAGGPGTENLFQIALVIDWLSRRRAQEWPLQETFLAKAFRDLEGGSGIAYALALAYDLQGAEDRYREALTMVPRGDPWYPLAQGERKAGGKTGPADLVRWYAELQKQVPLQPDGDVERLAFVSLQESVCRKAAASLHHKDNQFVGKLLSLARDGDEYTLQAVAAFLAEIGPEAREAVPTLIPLTRHASVHVRWQAVNALGEIGPSARAALPALAAATKGRGEAVRARAQKALLQIR